MWVRSRDVRWRGWERATCAERGPSGALANFKKNGAQILEERVNNGRHVCWVAAPDGAQMELIEKI